MFFLIIILLCLIGYVFIRDSNKWLHYGTDYKCKKKNIQGRTFIVEQVSFATAKECAHYIYPIVQELLNRKGVCDTKYDWYDWSANLIAYNDVSVRLYRHHTSIVLIRSTFPISLNEMENIFTQNNWEL